MGSKKHLKDYNKLSYLDQEKFKREVSEIYGLNIAGPSGGKPGEHTYRSRDAEDSDFINALANDFDVRMAMSAANAAGKSKAFGKVEGISNIGDAWRVHKGMKKTHGKITGGDYASANDQNLVMEHFQDKAQDFADARIKKQLDRRFDTFRAELDAEKDAAAETEEPTRQASNRFLQAQQGVAATEGSMGGMFGDDVELSTTNPFASNGAPAPDADEQTASQAQRLLERTKSQIADRLAPATPNIDGL